MVFNLLTCLGLRQHHKVLDIGCGSLRCGRLLIPYLNKGNYFGVEPNKWLVNDGIQNEVGQDLIAIKKPCFSYSGSLGGFNEKIGIDFAFAQSIFSHGGKDIIRNWFGDVSNHLKEDGIFLITFLCGEEDSEDLGWVYPECVCYKPSSIAKMANDAGFALTELNWYHPRQTWAMLTRPENKNAITEGGVISWNNFTG